MTMDTDDISREEYWKYLLEYMDKFGEALDSLEHTLHDDYEEPLNDRTDDV